MNFYTKPTVMLTLSEKIANMRKTVLTKDLILSFDQRLFIEARLDELKITFQELLKSQFR